MNSLQQALVFLVQNLFQLYLVIVLLRFLLQVAKADFYNPLSQFIVRATRLPLTPLRRLVPGVGGFDLAALALALFVQIAMVIVVVLSKQGALQLIPIVTGSVAGIIDMICSIYFYTIFAASICSFIPATHHHPAVILAWQLVDPLLAPFRKLIPPMGGIDISPIFALLAIKVIMTLIHPLLIV